MSSQADALEKIARASQAVTVAADRWNAVELPAVADCLSSLESSAVELSDALDILRQTPRVNVGTLVSNILDLKRAAVRLERLTDASASFLRCAPGLACDEPGLYQAGGSLRYAAPAAEAGMQV